MQKFTVNFHPTLAPTIENIEMARELFFNQAGTDGEEAVFVNPEAGKRTWGFVAPHASLLFEEPQA